MKFGKIRFPRHVFEVVAIERFVSLCTQWHLSAAGKSFKSAYYWKYPFRNYLINLSKDFLGLAHWSIQFENTVESRLFEVSIFFDSRFFELIAVFLGFASVSIFYSYVLRKLKKSVFRCSFKLTGGRKKNYQKQVWHIGVYNLKIQWYLDYSNFRFFSTSDSSN